MAILEDVGSKVVAGGCLAAAIGGWSMYVINPKTELSERKETERKATVTQIERHEALIDALGSDVSRAIKEIRAERDRSDRLCRMFAKSQGAKTVSEIESVCLEME